MTRVGLISDTHGVVRAEAIAWLAGCDRILHAGDVCEPHVLDALSRIAPVVAVRGNNDRGAWADALPCIAHVSIDGIDIAMVHDLADFQVDASPRPRVVVFGHSHKPAVRDDDGTLFVNPGSAGPRRFRLPISIGELVIDDGRVEARTAVLCA